MDINGQAVDFDVAQFLRDFGYITQEMPTQEEVATALAEAQADYQLPVTGELDPLTLRIFALTPRCGVTDAPSARGQASAWGLKHLTYFIESRATNSRLTNGDFDRIMREAFDAITACCGLTFAVTDDASRANLVIGTGRGSRSNFDGPSGTLAWAYLPPSGNYTKQLSMRFDLDEAWSPNAATNGIILSHVAKHEFGHLMGLDHTRTSGQLMLPTYSPRIPTFQNEDIARLQERYGKPTAQPKPTPTPGTPPTEGRYAVKILSPDGKVSQFWAEAAPAAVSESSDQWGF